MDKKTKIIIAVPIIIISILAVGIAYVVMSSTIIGDPGVLYLEFNEDEPNKTLTVVDITPVNLSMNWNEVLMISGNATLLSGIISIGDVITNCSDSGEMGYAFKQSYNFFTGWKTITLPMGSWNFTS